MPNVGSQVARGSIWMVGLRFSIKFLGLINTMIIARILLPADFGLIAIAMAFYALVNLINSFGFDMVLIHNQDADKKDYDTAWTMQACFGLLGALGIFFGAEQLATFAEDLRLTAVFQVLAIMFFINNIRNIGVVDFRKQLDFKKEFNFTIAPKLLSTAITIACAFWLQSYWALIIGMFAKTVISVLLSYYMSKFRPHFSLHSWRQTVGFSKWLLLSNVLLFINNKFQDFLIGKVQGPSALGYFNIGNELANLPTTELIAPVNRATYPGYAKTGGDVNALQQLYLDVLSSISILAFPISIGLFCLANFAVPVLLGDKWTPAIIIVEIIALASLPNSLTTNNAYVYTALGKPKITTYLFMVRLAILVPALIYSVEHYGIEGAAYSILAVSLFMYPCSIAAVSKQLQLPFWQIMKVKLSPFLAGLLMFIVLATLEAQLPLSDYHPLIVMPILVAIGGLVYISVLLGMWLLNGKPNNSMEKKCVDVICRKLKLVNS
ncbi:lipopolysaccharide biosynthesis protein [Flocculibacter collagenilyticus]|uniref:lipopolysaccharide biosynthesis protein n=1 Tax=Flocculibacter collagenilyticus TaxID=2744479 RepID=UPI0018F60257|nr:lipopolysaccharide biosynthesis protein [Flocculibacter collagenilyticus]